VQLAICLLTVRRSTIIHSMLYRPMSLDASASPPPLPPFPRIWQSASFVMQELVTDSSPRGMIEEAIGSSSTEIRSPHTPPLAAGTLPPRPWRNLVVCLDGTANEFSDKNNNTNVIKLFSVLEISESTQLAYYDSGMGTYLPEAANSWPSLR
jgi:hypothetical protein